jgi:transketolase
VIALDNHYLIGGQGDRVADVFARKLQSGKVLYRFGIDKKPECGLNEEVLAAHGLDEMRLVDFIKTLVK